MLFILKYFVRLLYYLIQIFQIFNIDYEFIFLIFYFLKGGWVGENGCSIRPLRRATRFIFKGG